MTRGLSIGHKTPVVIAVVRRVSLSWQEWVSTIAQQSMGVDRRSWGSTIQCSHLSGPAVVLLGDAGHGVTPNLGQVLPRA